MKTYIIIVLAMLTLDLIGKVVILYTRNEKRDLRHTTLDILIVAAFIAGGFYAIGATA